MKNWILIFGLILFSTAAAIGQHSEKQTPSRENRDVVPQQYADPLQQQMQQMMQRMQQMFGTSPRFSREDSTQTNDFQSFTMPFGGGSDSSFSKSFSFSFDGQNWKNLSPDGSNGNQPFGFSFDGKNWKSLNGDTLSEDAARQMRERMKGFDSPFDLGDMFKGFDNFGNFGDPSVLPPSKPSEPRRKSDLPSKKDKKYKTDSL